MSPRGRKTPDGDDPIVVEETEVASVSPADIVVVARGRAVPVVTHSNEASAEPETPSQFSEDAASPEAVSDDEDTTKREDDSGGGEPFAELPNSDLGEAESDSPDENSDDEGVSPEDEPATGPDTAPEDTVDSSDDEGAIEEFSAEESETDVSNNSVDEVAETHDDAFQTPDPEGLENLAETAAPAARQLQKIDTPLSKFRTWLRGSTTVGRPLPKTQPVETSTSLPQETTTPEAAFSPSQARKELKQLRASQRSWESLIADREKRAEQARASIETNASRIRALTDWVTNFDRSYQWRVQQRMDQQLQQAVNDLRAYEQSAQNVEEFEAGRLVDLKRSFHRLIRQIVLVTVPIALATVLIPVIFEIPRVEALETFYDPRLSAPIISLVVVSIIAAIFLFRRASGKDTIRNITIVKWVVVTIIVGFIVIIAPVFEDQMRNVLVPYLEENQLRILLILTAITLLWILVALIIYYRGWSQYRRGIDAQLARLGAVISGYVETQQEVNRLTLLYQQTSEWLKILAFALYRPWVTPREWEEASHREADVEDFPFALRIAQVDDQVGAKSAELERIISSKLLVQGWRANAFRDLVDEVRKDMGLAQGKLSVDSLDKDLPHQTNNTRNLLRKYLESSAIDVSGTSGTGDDSRYLVEVARKRLMDLIEQTQSVALSAARPPVNHIVSDPLGEIAADSGLVDSADSSENWDGFLKETLGTDEVVQPPLSILNFTPEGQMNKVGEAPKTFVLIPQRLADAIPSGLSPTVNLIPVVDNSSRAVEIIVRVDVVGPVKPDEVRLLAPSSTSVSAMTRENRGTSPRSAELCQECFDPTCAASLDQSASCSTGGL